MSQLTFKSSQPRNQTSEEVSRSALSNRTLCVKKCSVSVLSNTVTVSHMRGRVQSTEDPVKFELDIILFLVYVPCNIWDIILLKQLFIAYLQSKFTGQSMFSFAKSGTWNMASAIEMVI